MAKYVFTVFACILIVYLVGAFVEWQFHPGAWREGTRLGCVMFAFPFSLFSCAAVGTHAERNV